MQENLNSFFCSDILNTLREEIEYTSASETEGPVNKVKFPEKLGWSDGWIAFCIECNTDGRYIHQYQ